MFVFSAVLLGTAVMFAVISIAIYRGKTDLIHSYHQTKVTDKRAYGKAFGKAMSVIAITMLISGIIGLLGDSDRIAIIAVAVLFAGLGIGFVCIFIVQVKYNKGLF